jgi:sugar phosphate isomerase/epimerase
MRIGYNTWSMATVPYTTFIPRLSDIGFTAVAISVVPGYTIGGRYVPNAADQERLAREDRARIKQAFEERGLELPSVIGNQSLVEDDPERNAAAMQRLRDSIDLCVELTPRGQGVPTLNTGIAGRSGDLEAKRQIILDRLGELARYAQTRGVTLCIEPHVGGAIDTPERAEYIVGAVNNPALRLDFDVSHFEVVGVPLEDSVTRLAPLARAAEIKDQRFRYCADGDQAPAGWLVPGNGVGRATAPDGRPVEFQFLLAGEGTFDLPGYLRLMRAHGFGAPIAFEVSVQCQARPDYDALEAAQGIYRWMAEGWRQAGIPTE